MATGDTSHLRVPDGVSVGDALLVGRVYRNVNNLIDAQPAVIITGSWLTVKEQMARTHVLALARRAGRSEHV
jgi:hypothetical protein